MTTEADALDRLAARLRTGAEVLEEQRGAVGRYAVVWWEGSAADRYRDLVEDRRAALASAAEEARSLADAVAALAVDARAGGATRRLGAAS